MEITSDLLIEDLGDGLILRHACPADTDALVQLNSLIHSDFGPDTPDLYVGEWTRDLLAGTHPTFQPGDFTIVEDTRQNKIVSTLNLISQTWLYEGIPFGVGRPELVGTDPAYRRKGLVRKQFELIHRWSAERGELVQAITGIPNYYRQFGYEMTINLGGSRTGFEPHVPQLTEGQSEPYRFRKAVEADIPFCMEVYAHASRRYTVQTQRDEAIWRYELAIRSEKNVNGMAVYIIETPEGEPLGYLGYPPMLWEPSMAIMQYELKPGASWFDITPSVVRFIWPVGQAHASAENRKHQAFTFALGAEHPVYQAFGYALPRRRDPYGWFIRVPDLPAFMRRIAPALETRLANSVCTGYSGELNFSFYTEGLKLQFEKGKLTQVTGWKGKNDDPAQAGFPDLSFLQLLFGYRSIAELVYHYADCWVGKERDQVVIDALFPYKPSYLWPVD